MQYLRDDYKKGHAIRKNLLLNILRKHRKKHIVKVTELLFEKQVKSQLQRTVNINDVKRFIQSDSMHLDDNADEENIPNTNNFQSITAIHAPACKKNKTKKSFYKTGMQQPLLMFKKSKGKDVPSAVEDAIRTVLTNENIVLYY